MGQKPHLDNKTILITGGTGSLGKTLIRRLLSFEMGQPAEIVVLSRDEAKQHQLMVNYATRAEPEAAKRFKDLVRFRIGDVRSATSVLSALKNTHVVINTAALKQVPSCEYFPGEAVNTNVIGAINIVDMVAGNNTKVETVVCISTDKAAKPVNVMGMTKALQERVFLQGSIQAPDVRFVGVRYGNVLASRGSVIPLFLEQIKAGRDLTITDTRMTRFLLSLDESVDLIFAALNEANTGELYIPRVPAALITDLAEIMIGERKLTWKETGIRPGEKLHEILISEEEGRRACQRGKYYAILPSLPELCTSDATQRDMTNAIDREYSSADDLMSKDALRDLLVRNKLMPDMNNTLGEDDEVIR